MPVHDPGMYGLPWLEYLNDPSVSSTELRHLRVSPLYARYRREHAEETDSMRVGSAVHCRILEPEKFGDRYAVWEGERRSSAGKQEYADLQASGKEILTRAEMDKIHAMTSAALENETIQAALARAEGRELSLFWQDPVFDFPCKARLDLVVRDMILDIKTASKITPHEFMVSIYHYGYHIQAAHYQKGLEAVGRKGSHVLFLVLQNSAPWETRVYVLDKKALQAGQVERNRLLKRYIECARLDLWPPASTSVEEIGLPRWAMDKIYEEE